MITPLRYDSSFEHVADDEAETIQAIVDTMHAITAKTLDDSGHANRSVHAKAHALLTGEMTVRSDLPAPLRAGRLRPGGQLPRGAAPLDQPRRHPRRPHLRAARLRREDRRRRRRAPAGIGRDERAGFRVDRRAGVHRARRHDLSQVVEAARRYHRPRRRAEARGVLRAAQRREGRRGLRRRERHRDLDGAGIR